MEGAGTRDGGSTYPAWKKQVPGDGGSRYSGMEGAGTQGWRQQVPRDGGGRYPGMEELGNLLSPA